MSVPPCGDFLDLRFQSLPAHGLHGHFEPEFCSLQINPHQAGLNRQNADRNEIAGFVFARHGVIVNLRAALARLLLDHASDRHIPAFLIAFYDSDRI
jgi:hypothetical protein